MCDRRIAVITYGPAELVIVADTDTVPLEILPEPDPEEEEPYRCRSCGRSPCAAWCEGS